MSKEKNRNFLKKIAILTSSDSWFIPFTKKLHMLLSRRGYNSKIFFKHEEIPEDYHIVFILSYYTKIPIEFIKKHSHNLVVHESDLPKGKGWSPLFWQILEDKNKIPIVLFEATSELDSGDIYIKDYIELEGHELHAEIRKLQGEKTIELCLRFLDEYFSLCPLPQKGKSTFYPKRTIKDSEININKSIKDIFNLLRIVDNEKYPAFFHYRGHKYILKIYKENK